MTPPQFTQDFFVPSAQTPKPVSRVLPLLLAVVLFAGNLFPFFHAYKSPSAPMFVSDFSFPQGVVAKPMPYRIVSFHRGRADKNLIKLAAQLGFNGVQFQIEGSNQLGIQDFADRDAKEHLVDYCHSLGMKVTLWVHELSDLPAPWMPNFLGENTLSNDKLKKYLDARYEWILSKATPNVDGLVLTVVETQVRATNTSLMLNISELIREKCDKYHKSLMVRTFVWTPEEFETVMAAVNQLPEDTVLMSKIVPQDWQMRGPFASEIGAVGKHPQIIEFDVEGEYFLHNAVANCMPDLLKKQFDYIASKNVAGICVRVDRFDDTILFQPSEVNLWTLGLLSCGNTNSTSDIWQKWASYRYPTITTETRDQVIKALKPTAEVVAELLSIGPFTHGDTRKPIPLPDEDNFSQNWQPWRWDSSLKEAHEKAESGDPEFIKQVAEQKTAAAKIADQCLADLEKAKAGLPEIEYRILRTKLLTNRAQLAVRTPMQLLALQVRAALHAKSPDEMEKLESAMHQELQQLRQLAYSFNTPPTLAQYLGRQWQLDVPEAIDPQFLLYWAWSTQLLIEGNRHLLPPPSQAQPVLPPYAQAIPPLQAPTTLP